MGSSNKVSTFRVWLQEMWMQHKEELSLHGQVCDYSAEQYFSRYKYWLKREYQHQRTKE